MGSKSKKPDEAPQDVLVMRPASDKALAALSAIALANAGAGHMPGSRRELKEEIAQSTRLLGGQLPWKQASALFVTERRVAGKKQAPLVGRCSIGCMASGHWKLVGRGRVFKEQRKTFESKLDVLTYDVWPTWALELASNHVLPEHRRQKIGKFHTIARLLFIRMYGTQILTTLRSEPSRRLSSPDAYERPVQLCASFRTDTAGDVRAALEGKLPDGRPRRVPWKPTTQVPRERLRQLLASYDADDHPFFESAVRALLAGVSYEQANKLRYLNLSKENHEPAFFDQMLGDNGPEHPPVSIHLHTLPPETRACFGTVHAGSQPAAHVLAGFGFQPDGHFDVLDGGVIISRRISSVDDVLATTPVRLEPAKGRELTQLHHFAAVRSRQAEFAAVRAPGLFVDGVLYLSESLFGLPGVGKPGDKALLVTPAGGGIGLAASARELVSV